MRLEDWTGGDCPGGGRGQCIMRENRIFSSDHKASEHMQKGTRALWKQYIMWYLTIQLYV